MQALIEVAGLSEETALKPEAIGFRLGPRINAVGRIADPQIVIDLLTTDDIGVALQRAMQCEEANKLRRQMCEIIEAQAVEWVEAQMEQGLLSLQKERVLVVVQPEWHHGVIGIVASRLVERYGVPVFIGTYEDKAKKEIRGSARSIPEFNVFEALQFCDDLLGRYGGHRAAGGFSFEAAKLRQVKSRLSTFACQHLQLEHLKPLVTVDVQAQLAEANLELYSQIDKIHPCGIENPDPVFWTANATVVEQKVIGKTSAHLKLTLSHDLAGAGPEAEKTVMKAIAWRWGSYYPLPRNLDIAYKLRLNEWNGRSDVELELVGARLAQPALQTDQGIRPWSAESPPAQIEAQPELEIKAAAAVTFAQAELTAPTAKAVITPVTTSQAAKAIALNLQQALQAKTPPASTDPSTLSTVALPPIKDRSAPIYATVAKPEPPAVSPAESAASYATVSDSLHVEFYYGKRHYKATLEKDGPNDQPEQRLSIENADGHLLSVKMSAREGYLQVPGAAPQTVDISDANYFNLIRAGLNALEIKQKTQLLIKKDELLAEKDGQISTLKAQIELLEEKISQLSAEQQRQFAALETERKAQEDTIQGQEAHIEQMQVEQASSPSLTAAVPNNAGNQPIRSTLSSTDIKQQVRTNIGDSVWFCLQAASQKDLQAAYRNYQTSYASGTDAHIADYSEAGIRLGFTVEREVIAPFFADLSDFLRSQSLTEIGGVLLGPNRRELTSQEHSYKHSHPGLDHRYRLDSLPPLLADQWQSFSPEQLAQQSLTAAGIKVMKVKAKGQVSESDRVLITKFLRQWEHPIASCFSQKRRQAASSLDQISKLCDIAVRQECFLHQWQYELLHQLIAGKQGKGGLLRQIFAA